MADDASVTVGEESGGSGVVSDLDATRSDTGRAEAAPARWIVVCIVLAAIVFAVGWRVVAARRTAFPLHDEAVSMLHASSKTDEYAAMLAANAKPMGTWVPASQWQAFMVPEGTPLGEIAEYIGKTDVAGPLHFWMLSYWLRAFGASYAAGTALNFPLAGLLALTLFGLARELLRDDLRAALVTLTWALMPPAIHLSTQVRQYDLLALLSVALLWAAARFGDPKRPVSWPAAGVVTAVTLAGAVTQHMFVLTIAAALGIAAVRSWKVDRRRVYATAGALAAGLLASLLVNPYVVDQYLRMGRSAAKAPPMTPGLVVSRLVEAFAYASGITPRIDEMARRLPGYPDGLPFSWVWGVLAVAAIVAIVVAGRSAARRGERPPSGAGTREWLVGAAIILSGTLVLVIGSKGVAQPIATRYLSVVWPLLAFLPVLLTRSLGRRGIAVVTAFVLVLLMADYISYVRATPSPRPQAVFGGVSRVVLDNPARGMLLRYVAFLDPDTAVYADWRTRLLGDRAWMDSLQEGDLLISADGYQPEHPDRKALAAALARWNLVRLRHTGMPWYIYRLERRDPGSTSAL